MKILIVDDAIFNVEVYKRILRAIPGAECIGFTASAAALVWAASNEPDLVLVDFNMPEPNGHQFIERFRQLKNKASTPIVMLTGTQERSVLYRAFELGVTDFLTTPSDPIEIVTRVRNLLALRDGQKKLADRTAWLAAEVKRATSELANREEETIFRLLRVAEFRDDDTGNHVVRIGHFAALLGATLGLSNENVELLRLAAPMHDIGKVATPDNILLKPGKLTPDEWMIMKQHTTSGYEILKDSRSKFLQRGAEIALTHHERFDGSGYPRGMTGEAIPLFGRITAVADVFDALTSVRPYKKAWPLSEAFDHIQADSGMHFDPKLVAAFLSVPAEVAAIKLQYTEIEAPRVA